MKIAVYGRSATEENISALRKLCELMLSHKLEVFVYKDFWDKIEEVNHQIICNYPLFSQLEDIDGSFDYFFSIGGDGTLLNTVDFVVGKNIPVIGINTGRLGFLANFHVNEIHKLVEAIQNNDFKHDHRKLLQINCNHNLFGENCFALNEFSIQKRDPSAVIKVQAYVNDEFLSSYWADGVIVSTPTGSTGYSLSTGGSILLPQSNVMTIAPIAPHNLNQRPLVLSDDVVLKLKIAEHRGSSYCTIDSKYWQIENDYEFEIKISQHTIDILRPSNISFVDSLRNKLMWGLDNRN